MSFNRSALIGFGNQISSGLSDDVFPQARSAGTAALDNDSSVNIGYPSSISANDILFIFVRAFDSNNLTTATASGFSEVARYTGGSTTTVTVLLWARATGSESGSLAVGISGGGGGTQSIWAVMWSVRNCVTSGNPYLSPDSTNGGGVPSSDWTSNPFTTTSANNGGMHIAFCNSTTMTTFFGWTGMANNIGTETPYITDSFDNFLYVDYFRCASVATYMNLTVSAATDASSGGKVFFSMELVRAT
jgi:hypothetical protein